MIKIQKFVFNYSAHNFIYNYSDLTEGSIITTAPVVLIFNN